jgi:hypothetical protein
LSYNLNLHKQNKFYQLKKNLYKSANDNKSIDRKMSGHAANTLPPTDNCSEILSTAAPTQSAAVIKKPGYTNVATKRILQTLVMVTNVATVIKSASFITEDMITTEPDNLSDALIADTFNLQSLQCYFDKDAWTAVESLVKAIFALQTALNAQNAMVDFIYLVKT